MAAPNVAYTDGNAIIYGPNVWAVYVDQNNRNYGNSQNGRDNNNNSFVEFRSGGGLGKTYVQYYQIALAHVWNLDKIEAYGAWQGYIYHPTNLQLAIYRGGIWTTIDNWNVVSVIPPAPLSLMTRTVIGFWENVTYIQLRVAITFVGFFGYYGIATLGELRAYQQTTPYLFTVRTPLGNVDIGEDLVNPSPVQIYKNGAIHNVSVVSSANASASRVRVMTTSGVKVLGKATLLSSTGLPLNPHVYIAGSYQGLSNGVAVSWEDNQAGLTELFSTADARANSVFVYAGDIYVAGYYTNMSGRNAAGYWKNGVLTVLYTDTVNTARANSIYVDATGVYVAGFTNDGTKKACYWKDGVRTDLYTIVDSEALGIHVASGNVYVAGYYNNGSNDVSCYWVNNSGGLTNLYSTAYSRAKSIYVSGGNVYVAGVYTSGVLNACTWTNNAATRTELGSLANAESIMVSGTDVCVAGYIHNGVNLAACTWRNGARIDLYSSLIPGDAAHAYSIFVYGGNIYVSGSVSSGLFEVACYWKNGVRTVLYSTAVSVASSIQAAE